MNKLDVLQQVANTDPGAITELEWTILLAESVAIETRRKAAEELAAKDARIAELESRVQLLTDAIKVIR